MKNTFPTIVVLLAVLVLASCNGNCDPVCEGSKCCDKLCYNEVTELCCDGVIHTKISKTSRCCGNQLIDFELQVCCDNVAHDRVYGKIVFCCGNASFTPDTSECCDGNKVVPKGNCPKEVPKEFRMSDISELGSCNPACQRGDKCCVSQCYDEHQNLCCNGTIVSKVGRRPQCCGSIVIDHVTQVCCDGVPHDRQGIRVLWCCGTESFSPLTDVCCNKVVVPRGQQPTDCMITTTEAAIVTTSTKVIAKTSMAKIASSSAAAIAITSAVVADITPVAATNPTTLS